MTTTRTVGSLLHAVMVSWLLFFMPGCIVTVDPLTPVTCPAPTTVYLPALVPAGCIGVDDIRVFELCVTGPHQLMPDQEERDLWGYRWLDEEHTMRGWQLYFLICTTLDRDGDSDIDLADFAIWQRRALSPPPTEITP
jgi:hypothetical protein